MTAILDRLDRRFRLLREQREDLSWLSPEALQQGAQGRPDDFPAYHALRALAGPQTQQPVWATDWTAPNGYTYHRGDPGPHLTDQQIHLIMMPQIRLWARKEFESKRAGYRSRGGEAASYSVDDLAGNMHAMLQQLLARKIDQGRVLAGGGFVSWVTRLLKGAGSKGVNSTAEYIAADGRLSELAALANPRSSLPPQELARRAQAIADRVQGQFQRERSHVKDPQNPFGVYSPTIYQLGQNIAQAWAGGAQPDQQQLQQLRDQAEQLKQDVEQSGAGVYGTDTGRRTIHTPHSANQDQEAGKALAAFKKTKIASIDAPTGPDGESGMDLEDPGAGDDGIDSELLFQVLKNGRNSLPSAYLKQRGLEPFTDQEYRYLIRLLAGPLRGKYPGQGVPGKDPELGPDGQPSQWVQEGMPWLTDREDILKSLRGSGGGADSSAGSIQALLQSPVRPLTPGEMDYITLALGINPDSGGKRLRNFEIANLRGVSKVNVGAQLKKALAKLGMTAQELVAAADGMGPQAAAGGGGDADVSSDPMYKFQQWMKLYQDEMSMDESLDRIDQQLVRECFLAVCRLYYNHSIRPLLERHHAAA